MAFLESFGAIFVGTQSHCYSPSSFYAYQVVGSTKKQPICRQVPVVMLEHEIQHGFGGSFRQRIDSVWLERNPLPPAPLKRASPTARSYRVSHHKNGRVYLVVPESRHDYGGGSVHVPLRTLEAALAFENSGSYCEY